MDHVVSQPEGSSVIGDCIHNINIRVTDLWKMWLFSTRGPEAVCRNSFGTYNETVKYGQVSWNKTKDKLKRNIKKKIVWNLGQLLTDRIFIFMFFFTTKGEIPINRKHFWIQKYKEILIKNIYYNRTIRTQSNDELMIIWFLLKWYRLKLFPSIPTIYANSSETNTTFR